MNKYTDRISLLDQIKIPNAIEYTIAKNSTLALFLANIMAHSYRIGADFPNSGYSRFGNCQYDIEYEIFIFLHWFDGFIVLYSHLGFNLC